MVFDEQKQGTKQLGYSTSDQTDTVPVMRSFLLQLLLEYKSVQLFVPSVLLKFIDLFL